jgi:hypothetical protein
MKMKQRYKFYVTDFAPNGTQDLVIADREGNIIEARSEAIWGLHVIPSASVMALGDQIVHDRELRESLMDAPNDVCFLYPTSTSTLMRHVAVSPVCDGSETVAFIKKYMGAK